MIDWYMVLASFIGEYVAFLAGAATLALLSRNMVKELVIIAVETCVRSTKRDYKERFKEHLSKNEKK